MAWLESNHGRLLVGFRFRGERCREYLSLDDNRDNRRSAAKLAQEIELELAAGKLDYAARFPDSPKLGHFGLIPQPLPASPEQNQKPHAPTLGSFAEAWLEERRAMLTVATACDYERLIKALLLPAPLAQKPIDEVNDGDINRFVGELMKRKGLGGRLIGPRRINMIIARLRTIFATAKRRKLISEDPMAFVQNLREPKAEVDPFTLDEARKAINAASGQDRAVVTVLSSRDCAQTRRWHLGGKTSI